MNKKLSWHGRIFYNLDYLCYNFKIFSIKNRIFIGILFFLFISTIQIFIGWRSSDPIIIAWIIVLLFIIGLEKTHDKIFYDYMNEKIRSQQEKTTRKFEEYKARTMLLLGRMQSKFNQSN